MWNSCAKLSRLKEALEYRGLDPKSLDLDVFWKVLRTRGIIDKVLNRIVWTLLEVLEPPGCGMPHCEYYGGQASFCDCAKGEIPGKCKINRDYLKRIRERAVKDADLLLEAVGTVFEGDVLSAISEDSLKRYDFFDGLAETYKELDFSRKWNRRRQEEVVKVLLARRKKI